MGIIDEIKQKVDIVEVIGQYVQLVKSGRTLRAPCPFHSEKKPSFFVYPEQQTWHCFGACNTGGDVFSFVMKKEGLDFNGALQLLAEKNAIPLPARGKSEAEDRAVDRILQVNQAAAQYYHHLFLNNTTAEKARTYLKSRGVNEQTITAFQIGYSLPGWESLKTYMKEKGFVESELLEAGLLVQKEETGSTFDRFRDHIMFPITDDRGRIHGFGARVLEAANAGFPKYINSPQTRLFDKSGSLYGIHLAKSAIRQQELAILVEGYMDVIIAHQYGFANVVAPMGVAITDRQINQIKKLTRNIALALDPDAAGEEAAMRCIGYENTLDADVKVISLPQGKDPDEVIKEDSTVWQKLVEKAIPVVEYSINVIAARSDLKKPEGKTEAINKLLPIVAGVKAGPRQYRYLTSVSLATGISEKRLEAILSKYKNEKIARQSRIAAAQKATRSVRSSPVEEYILALLLQHPELKTAATGSEKLLSEYFENSENRAIFDRWHLSEESSMDRESLEPAIREHLDALMGRNLPDEQILSRYTDCVLRLREIYLRNLKRKQEAVLAFEAESGDTNSVLAKLQEQGNEINNELAKIFYLRAKAQTAAQAQSAAQAAKQQPSAPKEAQKEGKK